jgi:hypothetical protein
MSRLDHPFFVKLYFTFQDDEKLCILCMVNTVWNHTNCPLILKSWLHCLFSVVTPSPESKGVDVDLTPVPLGPWQGVGGGQHSWRLWTFAAAWLRCVSFSEGDTVLRFLLINIIADGLLFIILTLVARHSYKWYQFDPATGSDLFWWGSASCLGSCSQVHRPCFQMRPERKSELRHPQYPGVGIGSSLPSALEYGIWLEGTTLLGIWKVWGVAKIQGTVVLPWVLCLSVCKLPQQLLFSVTILTASPADSPSFAFFILSTFLIPLTSGNTVFFLLLRSQGDRSMDVRAGHTSWPPAHCWTRQVGCPCSQQVLFP